MVKKNQYLEIINARENNLANIDISIPHNQLVGITGVSGSGKSSLAFGTIYAEGQRRYLETFSPYIRQFFDKHPHPEVDLIKNLRPTLAIQQKTRILQSRSTVGTLTHMNDLLKVLWGNLATAVCPDCSIPLVSYHPDELAKHLVKLIQIKKERNFIIGSRLICNNKNIIDELNRHAILGFTKIFSSLTGQIVEIEDLLNLPLATIKNEDLILVIQRIKSNKISYEQLLEVVKQTFQLESRDCLLIELRNHKKNLAIINNSKDQINELNRSYLIHTFFSNPKCEFQNIKLPPPRSSLFTFNHPLGACPECHGFGMLLNVDLVKVIPDSGKSIEQNCIQCWNSESTQYEREELIKFCHKEAIPTDLPWNNLSNYQQDKILNAKTKKFIGVYPWFKWLESKKYKIHVRVFLSRYKTPVECSVCNGSRLTRDALAYHINGKTLPQIWRMSIEQLSSWLNNLKRNLTEKLVSTRALREIFIALDINCTALINVGLPYLTLDRQARTLSGGETQRVNLVSAIGSPLVSTLFILDEPSVGLHARDRDMLAKCIRDLQKRGNSVILVEHDQILLSQTDYTMEIGPGGGSSGGKVTFSDSTDKWKGIKFPKIPATKFKSINQKEIITFNNLNNRNLKNLDLNIPLNSIVALTGVSGSGKSTILQEVLLKKVKDDISNGKNSYNIKDVVYIDQTPLVKSPRANIATYTKIWDSIRNLLAKNEVSQKNGFTRSYFSFNVKGGRCNHCEGAGYLKEEMQFLSDVYTKCTLCNGQRFKPEILDISILGKNVSELLTTSVDSAFNVFNEQNSSDERNIIVQLELLKRLGLGHLNLGASLQDISGGEAQRLKIAPYIADHEKYSNLLFLLDEPTIGLHLNDVVKLIELLHHIRNCGHSIVSVAHNLILIENSDWVIDLGPEGGDKGGYIVAEGTPLDVSNVNQSYTGNALKKYYTEKNLKRKFEVKDNEKNISKIEFDSLKIIGAKEHNLKNISISLPFNKIIALTGASGSGKSTIAYDIIHAESQHHYLSCLSPYARQFVNSVSRPDVENIINLPPTINISQHTVQPSSYSTVGTISEIYHYLRLLYSKIGTQYCIKHPENPVGKATIEHIIARLKFIAQGDNTNFRVFSPIIRDKKGTHREILQRAIESDIIEVRVDGEIVRPSQVIDSLKRHISHTIEYVVIKGDLKRFNEDLLKEALQNSLSIGAGTIILSGNHGEELLSLTRNCSICNRGYQKPDPEDFSFSSKRGKCNKCEGKGSLNENSICTTCNGTRLKPESLSVKIEGLNIVELANKTAPEVLDFIDSLTLDDTQINIVKQINAELIPRLKSLIDLGLNYLALTRSSKTLSSGELQRLRLSTALGSTLSGIMYIFDEPSVGLHPLDNFLVLNKIKEIKEVGNSILLIEHDPQSILFADHIVELGPEGGKDGGNIVFNGSLNNYRNNSSNNIINNYGKKINLIKRTGDNFLEISNGNFRNIKSLKTKVPLEKVVAIAGVSGAGKSSFIHGIIINTLIEGKQLSKGIFKHSNGEIRSSINIDRILSIDQKPIGANCRSTPASYLGILDPIRKIFAETIVAKTLGLSQSYFSYNTGQGKCPECKGQGEINLEMSFLPNAKMTCQLCLGARYNDEARSINFKSKNISQILKLTIEEAKNLFINHRKIYPQLRIASELGIGYLTLGQPAPSLSGGESQRLKLALELSKKTSGHTLYIFDEPTLGLHISDVRKLMRALHQLVDLGNSVIIIEHDMEVLQNSDHIIELGPSAAENGGKIVFNGNFFDLSKVSTPWGKYISSINSIDVSENL
jgi:excinuclease ABC subunit A